MRLTTTLSLPASRLSLSLLRFCRGNAEGNGARKPQLGKVSARKLPLTRMKRLARKTDRSVRTCLRFVAVAAALVAVVVYWNFGHTFTLWRTP